MKTVVIIGAGQMGRAAAELLNPNIIKLLAFGDNDPKTWSKTAEGQVPKEDGIMPRKTGRAQVLSVEDAIGLDPDEVLISVFGDDRAEALTEQVNSLGHTGPVRYLKDSYDLFDIRSRCIAQMAERIRELRIPGAVAELGVYRGDTAWQLNLLFSDRELYLFDTFEGFDPRDTDAEDSPHAKAGRFSDTSAEMVLQRMPHPGQVIIRKGYFPETLPPGETDPSGEAFALVSLDPDLYAPTLAGLQYFYPRLSAGGVIIVHDYNNRQFEGVKQAVKEFEQGIRATGGEPLRLIPLGDLHGSCVIIK